MVSFRANAVAFASKRHGRRGAGTGRKVTPTMTRFLVAWSAAYRAEWRGVGFRIVRKNGLSAGGEMFAWLADGADPDHAAAAIGTLPPPARLVFRGLWKPRYDRTSRW